MSTLTMTPLRLVEAMPAVWDADFRTPCQDEDPEQFFADVPAVIERAKAVCAGCALRVECLEGALRRREPHGVWGGELFEDGVVIAQKRPRGRPRKQACAPEAEPLLEAAA